MFQTKTGYNDLTTTSVAINCKKYEYKDCHQIEPGRNSDNHLDMISQPLSRDQFIVIIPEWVDVERIKRLCEYANLDYKKAFFFIHLVCEKTAYIKSYKPFKLGESYVVKEDKLTSKRAADLPDDELQTYFVNDASHYYRLLHNLGILYRAPFSDGQCFSYGLQRGFYASRFKLIVLEDYSMMNKIRGKHYADIPRQVKKTKSKVSKPKPELKTEVKTSNIEALEEHFCYLFNKTKFSVDYQTAEEVLFKKYHSDTVFPLSNYQGYQYNQQFKSFTAYHTAVVQLANFLNGKYSFSRKVEISPTGKVKSKDRFYTSISMMNKIVRGMLYYEGEKLVQLDVKNCTPYLLSNYLPSLFSSDEDAFLRLFNSYGFFFKHFRYRWCENSSKAPVKPYDRWFKGKFKHKAGKFGCHISSVELKSLSFTYVLVKNLHADITNLNSENINIGESNPQSYYGQSHPITLSKCHQKFISVIFVQNSLCSMDSCAYAEDGFKLTENSIMFTSNESFHNIIFDPNPKVNYEISLTPSINYLNVISDGSFPGLCFNHFIKAQYQNDFNSTEINVELTSKIGFNNNYFTVDYKAQYPVGYNTTENYVELPKNKCNNQKRFYFNFSSSLEQVLYYISQESLGNTINREFDDFLVECIAGKMYDNLVPHVKILYKKQVWSSMFRREFKFKYEENYKNDRDMTKKLFISMMYAANDEYKEVQGAFSKVYPVIYDIIYQRKQENPKELINWGFLKDSELIVDKIARPLITKHKIVAFTIHDCVMVKERHIQKLRTKMEQVFEEEFGNVPRIKKE